MDEGDRIVNEHLPAEIRAEADKRRNRRWLNLPVWAQKEFDRLRAEIEMLKSSRALTVGEQLVVVRRMEFEELSGLRAKVRAEAIEEAAKIADDYPVPTLTGHVAGTARNIAAAIRALAVRP